jgi:hypothetical protein
LQGRIVGARIGRQELKQKGGLVPVNRIVRHTVLLLIVACGCFPTRAEVPGEVERVDPPAQGFYGKRMRIRGITIRAHADVSDAALEETARRILRLLARTPEIAKNLQLLGAEMHIIGKDQQTSDLPEYRHMKGKPFEGTLTIDQRGRGFGGLHASCSEENVLLLPSDHFKEHRDICSHEFAHTIYYHGLSEDIRELWKARYRVSMAAGRWATMYAAKNDNEFFAELTMWYQGSRGDYGKLKPAPQRGALWLRSYDPEAYALMDRIYSGALKPKKCEVRDLVAQPADREGRLHSLNDQPATSVLFVNRTDGPVRLFWLDFDGQRKAYGEIAPGAAVGRPTFQAHAWLVENAGGKCLGIYVAEKTCGRVVID